MCYAYGNYFREGVKTTTYKKYMAARFARVYPLHFVTTIWMFVCSLILIHVTGHGDEILNPKALPASLLLIQSMHVSFKVPPLNTPSWSLSTEWWVYILFPFCLPFFIQVKNKGKVLITIGIIAFYIFLRNVIGPISNSHSGPTIAMTTDFGFLRCLAGFFTGMLLFTFHEQRLGYNIIKRDWFFIISFLGLLGAMYFGITDIIIVAFFPLILIAAAYNQTLVKKILDKHILQRLGDWSFSIYLVHVPIIFTIMAIKAVQTHIVINKTVANTVHTSIPTVVSAPNYILGFFKCIILLALTILLSALFYRFLEIPARNYFNKKLKTKHKEITIKTLEV